MSDIREMIEQAQRAQHEKRAARAEAERKSHDEDVRLMMLRQREHMEYLLPDLCADMNYRYGPNDCFSHSQEYVSFLVEGVDFHCYAGYIDHDYRLQVATRLYNNGEVVFYQQNRWRFPAPDLQEQVLAWIGETLAALAERRAEWEAI